MRDDIEKGRERERERRRWREDGWVVGRSVAWDISVRLGWLSRDEAPWRRSRSLTYHPHGCDRQLQYHAHGQSRPPSVSFLPLSPALSSLTLERATPDCTSVPAAACQVACLPACLLADQVVPNTTKSIYLRYTRSSSYIPPPPPLSLRLPLRYQPPY